MQRGSRTAAEQAAAGSEGARRAARQVFAEAEVRASVVFQLSRLAALLLRAARLATGGAAWDALVAGARPNPDPTPAARLRAERSRAPAGGAAPAVTAERQPPARALALSGRGGLRSRCATRQDAACGRVRALALRAGGGGQGQQARGSGLHAADVKPTAVVGPGARRAQARPWGGWWRQSGWSRASSAAAASPWCCCCAARPATRRSARPGARCAASSSRTACRTCRTWVRARAPRAPGRRGAAHLHRRAFTPVPARACSPGRGAAFVQGSSAQAAGGRSGAWQARTSAAPASAPRHCRRARLPVRRAAPGGLPRPRRARRSAPGVLSCKRLLGACAGPGRARAAARAGGCRRRRSPGRARRRARAAGGRHFRRVRGRRHAGR